MNFPYQIFNPLGQEIMHAPEECRYPPRIELDMLEAGYTIRLHGKRITKAALRKESPANGRRK